MHDFSWPSLKQCFKRSVFLSGLSERGRVETNVYWAWVLYLSHLIQMKILWGHYYRPIIPYPKLWSHDFRKVVCALPHTSSEDWGCTPNQPHSCVCSKTYDSHTKWGQVSLLYTYEKIFTHCFQSFLHFWIVDKIVWPELSPSYRLRELA